jgi:two-component system NtrC family response regulator
MTGRLLIVEDDPGLASQMRWCFDGLDVAVAADEASALAEARRTAPDVVTLDLGLPPDPGGTRVGFALLESLQALLPEAKIIVITGREEQEHALRAIALGAYDYYQKPVQSDTLAFVVNRALRLVELERRNRELAAAQGPSPLTGIIAASRAMLELCRKIERVAPTDATVLVLGETGTGKELVARAIHAGSERRTRPFVAINCAAIPENLLESELFGHEKGSFTGAVARKIGKIENANGGTLFLDEIGDMPAALQAKILRFLQERQIERVGGTTPIDVDVRVISATHRPIEQMLRDGAFREDLYFRISEISLTAPPLREREGDAVLIARALGQRYAERRRLRLSTDAISAIEAHAWPGNVRELENRMKRACIMAEGNQITARDLELEPARGDAAPPVLDLRRVRDAAERDAIVKALAHADHNLARTARLLGISRPTLYNLLDKHGLADSASSRGET